ncbi:MAG: GldG family protein [bacterium]|nr:GldG family protein [bacterium]
MADRNYLIWTHSLASCLLLGVVLVLVNMLFAGTTKRVDLTEEGLFTLSDGSHKILAKLRDPVAIQVFWGGVPPMHEPARRMIEGLLDEIDEVAGDLISVRWIDTEEEDGKEEAERLGIPEFTFGSREGNKQVRSSGFMTLRLESGDAEPKLVDAVAGHVDNLEYVIMSDLDKRTRVRPPRIAFLDADTPELKFKYFRQVGGRFSVLAGLMFDAFGQKSVQVLENLEKGVPPDVDVLLLVAPDKIPEEHVYSLEQFALRGGRLVILLDPVNVHNTVIIKERNEPRVSGLESWLSHMGITTEYGLVGDFGDESHCPFYFMSNQGRGPYAYWPLVLEDQMAQDLVGFQGLKAVPMCWPSGFVVDEVKQDDNKRTVRTVMRTSRYGHRRPEIGLVGDTLTYPRPEDSELDEIPLALLIEGPLQSMWAGKPIPGTEPAAAVPDAGTGEDGGAPPAVPGEAAPPADPGAPADGDEPGDAGGGGGENDAAGSDDAPKGPPRLEQGDVRILLFGDAEMVANYMGPQQDRSGRTSRPPNGLGGFALVQNVAAWLTGGEELIELRARKTNPRKLKELETDEQRWLKLLNLLSVPLLLLAAGIVVFAVRHAQRSS